MLILFFIFTIQLPKRKGTEPPALIRFRFPGSRQTRVAILLTGASQGSQENPGETACLQLGSNRQSFCTSLVPPVLRGRWDLGMQPLSHCLRRTLFAPWFLLFKGFAFQL